MAEAFGVAGHDGDVDGGGAGLAVACGLAAREDTLALLKDRRNFVGLYPGPAARVHARGIGKGQRGNHAARARRSDHATGVEDVGELRLESQVVQQEQEQEQEEEEVEQL